MSNYYCSRQRRTESKAVILGAWVMGLYVSFPTAGLICGLVSSTASGVDTTTGLAFVMSNCSHVSFVSSTFAGCVCASQPPSPLRFLATGSFSSAKERWVVSKPPSFGWISLRIPWLVLFSSIICRNMPLLEGWSKRPNWQDFVSGDVRIKMYLVQFVTILDYGQLDIVIHWKDYIVVKGRLFGRTMKSSRVKRRNTNLNTHKVI